MPSTSGEVISRTGADARVDVRGAQSAPPEGSPPEGGGPVGPFPWPARQPGPSR
jgi:hypothetical protein